MAAAKNVKHSDEKREECRRLYFRGWTVAEITRETGVAHKTITTWRDRDAWDHYLPADTPEIALSRRIVKLSELDRPLTDDELKELEKLTKTFGGLQLDSAKARRIDAESNAIRTGKLSYALESGDGEKARGEVTEKKPKGRTKKVKNDISGITPEALDALREKLFYEYQRTWYAAKYIDKCRTRFILKSRQIGATYYFAFEALDDAIRTGDNQIFLSASRDQAEVFRAYIIAFAHQHFEVELKGQGVITLSNGAELRFLSTNSNTAQSYHGHLYIDEVFWIPNFARLWKVASGMAAHKKWRITMMSTPSAISHQAYAKWGGEEYNKRRAEKNKVEFDVSHEALKDGVLGPDRVWRHMVTVEDAERQGCDLFDIESLRDEYGEDDFANLFMCKFIDDNRSVFTLEKLLRCTVDVDDWPDYQDSAARPFGNKPVSVGYDPSRTRDNASLALLAVPLTQKESWRVLRTKDYHGQNFQYQSNRIKDVKETHNVVHIGIDTTGIGHGVFELVSAWYPLATPIHYSLDMKTQLVLKALDVIDNGRFRYRAGDHEITRAFLLITQTTTGSGLITYSANRSSEAGHADLAWSVMHGLIYEPLDSNRRKTTAVFSH
jgi:uncharacterized protein YjcR